MYQTFNMGMGFSIIVDKEDVDDTINLLRKYSQSEVKIVGKIEKGKGVSVPKLKLKY